MSWFIRLLRENDVLAVHRAVKEDDMLAVPVHEIHKEGNTI